MGNPPGTASPIGNGYVNPNHPTITPETVAPPAVVTASNASEPAGIVGAKVPTGAGVAGSGQKNFGL